MTKCVWRDLCWYNGKVPKCLKLSFFLKRIRICLIFERNKWNLASIAYKGRSPSERGLTSSASRGLSPLVLLNWEFIYNRKVILNFGYNTFSRNEIKLFWVKFKILLSKLYFRKFCHFLDTNLEFRTSC